LLGLLVQLVLLAWQPQVVPVHTMVVQQLLLQVQLVGLLLWLWQLHPRLCQQQQQQLLV
jgi:sensor domain CHASE-containing protein